MFRVFWVLQMCAAVWRTGMAAPSTGAHLQSVEELVETKGTNDVGKGRFDNGGDFINKPSAPLTSFAAIRDTQVAPPKIDVPYVPEPVSDFDLPSYGKLPFRIIHDVESFIGTPVLEPADELSEIFLETFKGNSAPSSPLTVIRDVQSPVVKPAKVPQPSVEEVQVPVEVPIESIKGLSAPVPSFTIVGDVQSAIGKPVLPPPNSVEESEEASSQQDSECSDDEQVSQVQNEDEDEESLENTNDSSSSLNPSVASSTSFILAPFVAFIPVRQFTNVPTFELNPFAIGFSDEPELDFGKLTPSVSFAPVRDAQVPRFSQSAPSYVIPAVAIRQPIDDERFPSGQSSPSMTFAAVRDTQIPVKFGTESS